MLTVKEWMELVEYRLTEGDSYLWKCFGDNAYSLSAWNGDHDGWSFNMVFDTETQVVYTAEACDYARDRAYRLINPDFKQAHDDEAKTRGISANEAWDDVNYVDLETVEDFIQKGQAIRDGVEYDTRVSVPLTVPDDVLFEMMKKAHEQDITLNQLVENVLWEAIRAEEDRRSNPVDDDGWDSIADDHWDDDGDEMASDVQDMRDEYDFSNARSKPVAAMKAKKKKKK